MLNELKERISMSYINDIGGSCVFFKDLSNEFEKIFEKLRIHELISQSEYEELLKFTFEAHAHFYEVACADKEVRKTYL